MTPWMGKPVWMWAIFLAVVGTLMVVDLGVFHKKNHVIGTRESLITCGAYMLLAVLFGGWVAWQMDGDAALKYLTGYVVEFSLSMDNVFVIAMIVGYFHIPRQLQHRVLFWGILGAIVLRGVLIIAGAALVQQFGWILYFFAAFLIFTGIKMLLTRDEGHADLKTNPLLTFLRKYGRVTDTLHGDRFFVRLKDNNTGHYARYMTPMFAALILVEAADVVFAVDSVPAIFAITTDPYLVFTSNIFAIMGLRSLYFALSAMMERFAYLKYALALVLVFIGVKIGLAAFGIHMPQVLALLLTVGILGSGVAYSLWKTRKA